MDKPGIRVGTNVNGPVIVGDGNRVTIHRSPYLWIVLTVLVVMGAATIFLLTGDDDEPPAAADKPAGIRPGAYTVILEGSAAGGAPFTRQGE